MKKSKSTIIYFLIGLFIISLIYYFNFNTTSKINISINNTSYSFKEKSDINFILDSMKTSKISNNIDTKNLIYIDLEIINKRNKTYKRLYIDYNNSNIYLKNNRDKNIYKLSENHENYYFTHENFERIYKYRIPSSMKILSNGVELKSTINSNWNYRKLDGEYYSVNENFEYKDTYTFKNEELLNFSFSYKPIKIEYELYKNSLLIDKDILKDMSFKAPIINGDYTLVIKSFYNDKANGYKGVVENKLNFKMDLPVIFSIDKENIYQGDILKITANNLDSNEIPYIKQDVFKSFTFSEIKDGTAYGYIPISYKIKEGTYTISYGINDKNTGSLKVKVIPRDFSIQYLVIDEETEKNTRSDEAYVEYNKYFKPRRYESNSTPYFDKPFIIPVKGRITTEYGQTRYVNGSPTSYNHSGLDIAAPLGTKIVATNSGKVKLSMYLTLTGNTLLIDHGNGFFSVYYHLEERFVNEGDTVKIGQEIGTVGSTGFSTGPHLHFNISYYDQNLEPGYFIYNEPVTYENYKALFDLE